jgi:hypothetical protein
MYFLLNAGKAPVAVESIYREHEEIARDKEADKK